FICSRVVYGAGNQLYFICRVWRRRRLFLSLFVFKFLNSNFECWCEPPGSYRNYLIRYSKDTSREARTSIPGASVKRSVTCAGQTQGSLQTSVCTASEGTQVWRLAPVF